MLGRYAFSILVGTAITLSLLFVMHLLIEHAEDAISTDVDFGLMVVADGMGGYKAGEVASAIAEVLKRSCSLSAARTSIATRRRSMSARPAWTLRRIS